MRGDCTGFPLLPVRGVKDLSWLSLAASKLPGRGLGSLPRLGSRKLEEGQDQWMEQEQPTGSVPIQA